MSTTSVCIARENAAKLGALFFEKVVPIGYDKVPKHLLPDGFEDWSQSSIGDIKKLTGNVKKGHVIQIDVEGTRQQVSLTDDEGIPNLDALEWLLELEILSSKERQSTLSEQMANAGISKAPLLFHLQPHADYPIHSRFRSDAIARPTVEIASVSWGRILELRRDLDAVQALYDFSEALVAGDDVPSKIGETYISTLTTHELPIVNGVAFSAEIGSLKGLVIGKAE
ncbi:MAG: hypothetical protein AAF420_08755 [Pseudomonadota bacterium]